MRRIFLIVIAIILLAGLAMGAFAFIIMRATSPVAEAATQHLELIKQGKIEEAYNECAQEFKEAVSLAEYQSFVEANPVLANLESWDITNREFENDIGLVEGTLRANGEDYPFQIQLVKRDGVWRVVYIEVGEGE